MSVTLFVGLAVYGIYSVVKKVLKLPRRFLWMIKNMMLMLFLKKLKMRKKQRKVSEQYQL